MHVEGLSKCRIAAAAFVTNRHAAEAHKPATSLVTRTRDPQVAGLDPSPEII